MGKMKTRRNLKLLVPAFLTALALVFTGCDNPLEDLTETTYYTVTFNPNGGSDVEAQKVESGTKATKPTDPTKASTDTETYSFGGWYTSTDDGTTLSDTAFDFETEITADLTLYAKWNASAKAKTDEKSETSEEPEAQESPESQESSETPAETYTITIAEDIENGSVTASKTSDIKAGETITLTIAPATKYELDSLSVTSLSSNQISGSGNTKTFTMPAQNVTVTITFKAIPFKSATEAKEVGDIVFNDGTAMSYTTFAGLSSETQEAIKTSAIALIFYRGTSSSDALGAKTLGVGLKHAQKAWCTMEANAYNTKIDTIYCAPSGSAGSLTFGDNADKNGSDNFIQIAAKLGEGTVNDDTGTESKYPAFYFAINYSSTATNLGTTYAGNWYLPSLAELFQIYACRADATNGFDIDAASAALGGSQFEINSYVSSSQYIADYATGVHTLSFNSGDYNYVSKKATHKYVCAIRAFDTNLYSVSIGSTANGSVNADKRSGIVAGETVTLTATPSDGYKLDSISATSNGNPVSLNGDGNTRTFTMPAANVNVTASFVITKI